MTGSRDTKYTARTIDVKRNVPRIMGIDAGRFRGQMVPDRGHAWARALTPRQRTPSGSDMVYCPSAPRKGHERLELLAILNTGCGAGLHSSRSPAPPRPSRRHYA